MSVEPPEPRDGRITSGPSWIQRERAAVQGLLGAIAERDRTEADLLSHYQSRKDALETEARRERAWLEARFRQDETAAQHEIEQAESTIPQRRDEQLHAVESERQRGRHKALEQADEARAEAEEEATRARWEAAALFEASRADANETLDANRKRLQTATEELEQIRADARQFLERRRMRRVAESALPTRPESSPAATTDPLTHLEETLAEADARLTELEHLSLPRLFRGINVVALPLVVALLTIAVTSLTTDTRTGLLVGLPAGLVLGALVGLAAYRLARRRVAERYPALAGLLDQAESLAAESQEFIAEQYQTRIAELQTTHQQELRKTERRLAGQVIELEGWRDVEISQADSRAGKLSEEIRRSHDAELQQIVQAARERLDAARRQFEQARSALDETERRRVQQFEAENSRAWEALEQRWRRALEDWSRETTAIIQESDRHFLDWEASPAATADWQPPAQGAPATRFGRFLVDAARLPRGTPRDPRLRELVPEPANLPALAPLPDVGGPFLVRAYGDGRQAATDLLSAVMLRLLTSIPPGKVRFTIVDPIGLGQNFAAFMHLADYDEALVGSRIWTEEHHIEARLADLTEHMEKVIQKYLRNEFQTIQDYNVFAGEVAEPYRVLVVANFPAAFNENSARRLLSICQNGPRCGVYPLIFLDDREPPPHGIALADLERDATLLAWRDGRLVWKDTDFGGYPLDLDAPPSDDEMTRLLRLVGERAREAARVEVPFEIIVPPAEQYWTGDSRSGLDVPLGRVGANKLQYLQLGKGTAQHALIAGRTGSGKSTLLHALIVSAALRYSPDEVEFYLIDFKKGVEFKTYASHHLPHARVVAIESEREFGLSVLQRLDVEMRERGETFRALGVQDLAGYRNATASGNGARPLPRILLVVDEFQEFFVDDDRLAQEAALLLDRLVRQGRAFGIHVLLGSQSLGGAFSLARSTMGQMAVRIALQCSESDAHLILNEENTAARLLSRPGEAIYNDSNGTIEGNNFFQVVWLSDSHRDDYLEAISELDRRRDGAGPPRPQIVFEGQESADLANNHLLRAALEAPAPADEPRAPLAWLGDAVAIKDPTAAVFRRQSGANLLVIGQSPESALSLFVGALTSLAAQHPRLNGNSNGNGTDLSTAPTPRFLFLDGTADDAPFADVPGRLGAAIPELEVIDWRAAGDAIARLADEVKARQDAARYDAPARYLFLYNLSRFRDLRKSEDDFGFSRRDDAQASPAQRFSTILRDGPAYGVHVLVWCDSWNNLQRMLDRQALREFEHRILFQMSPNDSSNLIDSPVAGKLGPHRALYANEEEGVLEKFRPYGLPSRAWLDSVRDLLHARPPASSPAGR